MMLQIARPTVALPVHRLGETVPCRNRVAGFVLGEELEARKAGQVLSSVTSMLHCRVSASSPPTLNTTLVPRFAFDGIHDFAGELAGVLVVA